MDVDRYEKDVAALTPSNVVSALEPERHRSRVRQRHSLYLDGGPGAETRRSHGGCRLRGNQPRATAAQQFSQCAIPARRPGFAPYTQFDSAGEVTGGFGVENVITATAHSTYHALQTSLSGTVGHGGPGIQASYTWSKSIDDTSQVLGGTGSTGAVAQGYPQDPFDTIRKEGRPRSM